MQIKANAKLNLTLDVRSKRTDGYHNIESIFVPIPLCDIIEIYKDKQLILTNNDPRLPNDSRNLAYRAACAFFGHTRISGGARIHITKNIPVGSGLGGGSSDAAHVLKALNNLYKTSLTQEALSKIAVSLGADVPFYINNVAALASGIGEKLMPLPAVPRCKICLILPDFSISTKKVFSMLNLRDKTLIRPDNAQAIQAIREQNLMTLCGAMGNTLETPASAMYPQIPLMKATLMEAGALGTAMTGSGSCVFGIFEPNAIPNVSFPGAKIVYFDMPMI